MKTMKKLSILLALCMAAVIVFAACGPKGGGNTPTSDETQTETATEEVTTEEVTTKEAEPADTGYPAAVLTSDTYTNEALNLKMTVPSTWTFYSKEDLAQEYNEGATEPVTGKGFYETYAQLTDGMFHDNVSVIVQDATGQTDAIKSIGITSFTEMAADMLPAQLDEIGAANVQYAVVDNAFPLDDYACIKVTYQLQGYNICQKQFVTLVGNYLYSITITSTDEAGADSIIGFFSRNK